MIQALEQALTKHARICEQLLRIASSENEALRQPLYRPGSHDRERHSLGEALDAVMLSLRRLRAEWQRLPLQERSAHPNIQAGIRSSQELAMKMIVLDRENEQALLRRGLVPPRHLAKTTAAPRPHFLSSVYRQNVR